MITQYSFSKIFILFIGYSLGLLLTFFLIDNIIFSNKIKQSTLNNGIAKIDEKEKLLHDFLTHTENTLKAIRESDPFETYLLDDKDSKKLENFFLTLSKAHTNFMQIRFINQNGLEEIRVDRKDQTQAPFIVKNLQDKSSRYYFKDSINKKLETVWYSRIDLNRENGKIETPYKPTLRAMFPVKHNNKFGGVIVINYFMKDFLLSFANTPFYDILIYDNQGFTISHINKNNDHSKCWGNSLEHKSNIKNIYPDQFEDIISNIFYRDIDFISKKLNTNISEGINIILSPKKSYLDSNKINHIKEYILVAILTLIFALILSLIISKRFSTLLRELALKTIALHKEKKKAIKASEAKSRFLANMSHEIRTPLNGIIGLTDLVLQTNLDETQNDYLQKAKKSSNALLYIINDILDYSKIEAGKLDIVKNEFHIEELLYNINALFGYLAHEKNINLNFHIDHKLPKILIGDPLRLTQVLNNLVGNALKFTHKGSVSIKLNLIKIVDNKVAFEICIVDTGIGISKENQKKLFQSFEQLDNSNTKKYGGTGLGLTISKKLIELMDGDIYFESKLNQGTKFCIDLNLEFPQRDLSIEDKTYKSPIDSTKQQAIKLLHSKKALVAEDNPINQIVIRKILEQIGFEVFITNDGLGVLEALEKQSFDIIFMDLQMPNMDGFETTQKIRSNNNTIPIIALSAAVMEHEKQLSQKVGMDYHLAKPIEKEKLYKIIKEFFESSFVEQNKTKNTYTFPKIEGIAIEKLIANIGDKDPKRVFFLYDTFKNRFQNFENTIKNYSFHSQEFWELIHTLKGSSGNLYIINVFNLCEDLEYTKADESRLVFLTKELIQEINRITTQIEQKISSTITLESNILDKSDIINQLTKMIEKLENFLYISRKDFSQFSINLVRFIDNNEKENIDNLFNKKELDSLKDLLQNILNRLKKEKSMEVK